jgi:glucokinase
MSQIEGRRAESLAAPDITRAALEESDALCVSVLNQFCALLGSMAGDLALTLGARGGVYIAGGIVPRFVEFLKQSPFRKRFEAKGRFSAYNAAITTRVIVTAQPGLLGAAAHQRAWHAPA